MRLRRRSLTGTMHGLGFRSARLWIAPWSERLRCFLRDTLQVRDGLLILAAYRLADLLARFLETSGNLVAMAILSMEKSVLRLTFAMTC